VILLLKNKPLPQVTSKISTACHSSLHHARSEAPSLCNKLSTTSASTSLQQPHHLYINKSPTITSYHCSSKAIPLIKPFLLAIPQPILPCNQPLVYHFVLLSLTFVKAYILSYFVIKQWNEISKDVVLGLPVFVSFSFPSLFLSSLCFSIMVSEPQNRPTLSFPSWSFSVYFAKHISRKINYLFRTTPAASTVFPSPVKTHFTLFQTFYQTPHPHLVFSSPQPNRPHQPKNSNLDFILFCHLHNKQPKSKLSATSTFP